MMHSSLPVRALSVQLILRRELRGALYTGARTSHAILSQGVFIFDCLMYEMVKAGVGLS